MFVTLLTVLTFLHMILLSFGKTTEWLGKNYMNVNKDKAGHGFETLWARLGKAQIKSYLR